MTDPTPQTTPTRDEAVIAGRTLEEWRIHARRDDCLERMVPSELRQLIGAILTFTPAPTPVEAGEALARRFHDIYERLAPSFGYETRKDTRQFDPTTPNGRLMIAVCSEIAAMLASAPAPASAGVDSVAEAYERCARIADQNANSGCTYREMVASEVAEAIRAEAASLSPAATPVSEAEPVAFPADGELLNMEDGERANAFWRWSKAAGLPLHMAESGLNRFHADDRTEWAWQAWCAALAKPASSPAGGDVVLLKAMAEGAGSMLLDVQRECIELRQIVVGFLDCPEIADCAPEDKDPETDALERRARLAAMSQSTSAGRVGE